MLTSLIVFAILNVIMGIIFGLFIFPLLVFLRARRKPEWDDSNLFNIYRVIAHLMIHPDDFGKMYYEDGSRPFWYINKDEFTDVTFSRPWNVPSP